MAAGVKQGYEGVIRSHMHLSSYMFLTIQIATKLYEIVVVVMKDVLQGTMIKEANKDMQHTKIDNIQQAYTFMNVHGMVYNL